MNGFIVWLIIILVISAFSKNSKAKPDPKNNRKPTAPKPVPAPKPKRSAQPHVQKPQPASIRPQPEATAMEASEAQALKEAFAEAAAKYEQLFSEEDEEGCIGGSMEHNHDEGESRAEHARHIETYHAAEQRTAETAERADRRRALRGNLRNAVIMSEVLDRPVALREPKSF